MKFSTLVSCAVLVAASIGQAGAQAACGQLNELMAKNHDAVKALQGVVLKQDKDTTKFATRVMIAGFNACTLESSKTIDALSAYWEHHLACEGEATNAEAANVLIESLWACTRDTYSERHDNEAWLDGRYRVIGFVGEAPTAGRAAGLVNFGSTDYARVVVEKAYDMSDEFSLNLYWAFTK